MSKCNGCKHLSDDVSIVYDPDNLEGEYKHYVCKYEFHSRLIYSTAEDHNYVPTPDWCPLDRWDYHFESIPKGLQEATIWIAENASHWDIVTMRTDGWTTDVVWREKLRK